MTVHVERFIASSKVRKASRVSPTVDLQLSTTDWQKLNRLIGHALVNDSVRQRLVDERDPVLLNEFGLSVRIQEWLWTLSASSLVELAERLVKSAPNGSWSRTEMS